ncbi:MAG: serine--tRNA ligase, partial [Parcubacteria group bacterium]
MLDIKYMRQQRAEVIQSLATRKVHADRVELVMQLDENHRQLLQKLEDIRAEKNTISKSITSLSPKEKSRMLQRMADRSKEEKKLKQSTAEIESKRIEALGALPNLPHPSVPVGNDQSQNKVVKTVGNKPDLGFTPLDYITLSERHGLIDIVRAAKISGSRFGYLAGNGAQLWFALMQYTFDILRSNGFSFFFPPVLVKKQTMENTGYDSYVEGQEAYYIEKDDLFLIGTGEHALVPYHSGETLPSETLPRLYAAYSTCFRREAGSYGKDTKGIMRVHQFDKIEMVIITDSDTSWNQFDKLVEIQERIVTGLKLPYHLLEVCTGDLPKPSAKVIDLECWIPSEGRYRETHSASNCTDYQARRNMIRYKESDQSTSFVHILNATAITPRILVAIIENY